MSVPNLGISQNRTVDSLKIKLNKSFGYKERIQVNNELAEFYLEKSLDTSLYYNDKALELASQHNEKLYEANALEIKGYISFRRGGYSDAMNHYSKALKIIEGNSIFFDFNSKKKYENEQFKYYIIANLYSDLGHLKGVLGDYLEQIDYYKKVIIVGKNKLGSSFEVMPLNNISKAYINIDSLDRGIAIINDGLKLLTEKSGNHETTLMADLYVTKGYAYLKKRELLKAKQNFDKAKKILESIDNTDTHLRLFFLLSKYYIQKQNIDSSLYYSLKTKEQFTNYGQYEEQINESTIYENIYKSYLLKSERDSAIKYLVLTLDVKDRLYKERKKILSNFLIEVSAGELNKVKEINRLERYLMIGTISFIILIALFMYRSIRIKQKANLVLRVQKEKIENTLNELKSTQAQLIQKEKLASLGELTAGIAHEIQNPLNFVNNFSEVSIDLSQELKEEIENSPLTPDGGIILKDKTYIDEIIGDLSQNQQKINLHGKRASSIVKGMLEHSRTATGERQLTDINQLADEYLRLSYHGLRAKDKDGSAARFNADYELITDEHLPKVEVVPQEIGRVLLNLLNNAFYAVNERAKQGETDYQPKVTVSTSAKDNQLEICVQDNGTGMTNATKAKIFQPFFTTKPTGEGTGLGLSLSYDIVTKGHGGTIECESVEGEETIFMIKLPI